MDPRKRMEFLAGELLRHQHLYYVQARPEVSDAEYDRLLDELLLLEKRFPQFAGPNSPSRRGRLRPGQQLSRAAARGPGAQPGQALQPEELRAVAAQDRGHLRQRSVGFTVEEKIDGASIVLYYDGGELQYALTRGNGLAGNDVSDNVRTIRQVPLRIAEPRALAVRGEIYITREDFDRYNAGLAEKYANPRNLAAGSLRNLKSALAARVPLNIFVYEGFFPRLKTPGRTEGSRGNAGGITWRSCTGCGELGFRVNPHLGFFSDDEEQAPAGAAAFPGRPRPPRWPRWTNTCAARRAARAEVPYDIDGLVVKVVELDMRQELGFTAHHPRWAMAYKFDSPQARTELLDVQVQVGRNGRVTPVALLKPVALSGSTVTRATLHNQDYIDMLELGIGDEVSISKRGDVIPAVEEVLEKSERTPVSSSCPTAARSAVRRWSRKGAHHFCRNEECPERRRRALELFLRQGADGHRDPGRKDHRLPVRQGLGADHPRHLQLSTTTGWQGEEGFKEKKIARIRASVEASKSRPFARVLAALGFEGVAAAVVGDLIAHGFDDIDKIIAVAARGDWETFAAVEGIGEATARQLVGHFSKPRQPGD